MNKKALIIGSAGQDGRLMTELLIKKNYDIFCFLNKAKLNIDNSKIRKYKIDIFDQKKIKLFFKKNKIDEIYFFPIKNISSEDNEKVSIILYNQKINTIGLMNILEEVKLSKHKIKFFFPSSSYIYSGSNLKKLTEKSPYNPLNNYGLSKLLGMKICEYYRENYNIYCTVGILFTHLSKFSKINSLIKRIVNDVKLQKNNNKIIIKIGNPNLKVNIAAAEDIVKAIYLIMQIKKPDNFVICSSKTLTIKQLTKKIIKKMAPKKKYIIIKSPEILNEKSNVSNIIGNNNKLKKMTKWKEILTIDDVIEKLI